LDYIVPWRWFGYSFRLEEEVCLGENARRAKIVFAHCIVWVEDYIMGRGTAFLALVRP
jgi:hypothetical protein